MPENYKYYQEVKHRTKLMGWKRLLANRNLFYYTVCVPFFLFMGIELMGGEVGLFMDFFIGEDGGILDFLNSELFRKGFEKGIEIYLYLLNILFVLRLWIFYNCNKNIKIFFYNHLVGSLCCLNLTLNNILSILRVDFRLTGILVIGGYTIAIIVIIYRIFFSKREEGIYSTLNRLEEKTKGEIYIENIFSIITFISSLPFMLAMLVVGCVMLWNFYITIKDFPYYETGKDIKSLFIKKNYSIELNDNTKEICIYMRSPSIGIVGRNEEGYDGFTYDEVEEQLFEDIRHSSYKGDWNVFVRLEYRDSYGNYYYDDEKIYVSTLNGDDLRRYAKYYYFKGKSRIRDAYPWNRKNAP